MNVSHYIALSSVVIKAPSSVYVIMAKLNALKG